MRAFLDSVVEAGSLVASNEYLVENNIGSLIISLEYVAIIPKMISQNKNIDFRDRASRISLIFPSYFVVFFLKNLFFEGTGAWYSKQIEDETVNVTSNDIKSFQSLKDDLGKL